MKKFLGLLSLIMFLHVGNAQTDSTAYLQKVSSLDSIMTTLYDVISGEAGQARDWDLFRFLYKDGAHLIPTGQARDGSYRLRYDTPDDYIEKSGPYLLEHGFFEQEIHRETQQFGNIAHIFSTYQCFKSAKEKEPFMRGINSVQLIFDGTRWWIVNIYWAQESDTSPIPANYLPEE